MLYKLNFITYTILALLSIIGAFAIVFQGQLMRIGMLCFTAFYAPCLHLSIVLYTIILSYFSEATTCKENKIMYNSVGDNFQDDVIMIENYRYYQLGTFFAITLL